MTANHPRQITTTTSDHHALTLIYLYLCFKVFVDWGTVAFMPNLLTINTVWKLALPTRGSTSCSWRRDFWLTLEQFLVPPERMKSTVNMQFSANKYMTHTCPRTYACTHIHTHIHTYFSPAMAGVAPSGSLT